MAFSNIAHRLSPEYPKFTETEDRVGNEYRYTGLHDLIASNKPEMGELWEDGRAVTDVKMTPSLGNSGWSELMVSTIYTRTFTTLEINTAPDEVRYRLTGQVSQVELAQHPDFLPEGPSSLYSAPVTVSGITARPIGFCILWENEPDPVARSRGQFYPRDPDGNATSFTPITVPAGAATAYVKLRLMGYATKDVYNPVWEKVSIYRGDNPPVSGTWGQYLPATDAFFTGMSPSVKAAYPQWVKSGDDVERVGNKPRWQRVERAAGYTHVYFDVDTLNPAGNALPDLG